MRIVATMPTDWSVSRRPTILGRFVLVSDREKLPDEKIFRT